MSHDTLRAIPRFLREERVKIHTDPLPTAGPDWQGNPFGGTLFSYAATISRMEYGLMVSTIPFNRRPHFEAKFEYSPCVRSMPPGIAIMTMSSSFERCGPGVSGTTVSRINTR